MFIISMCFHKNQNKTILTCIKRKQTQYSIDSCFSFIISGIVPYAYKNKYLLIKAIKDQIIRTDRFLLNDSRKDNRSSWRPSISRFYSCASRLIFSRCSLPFLSRRQKYRTNIWFWSMFTSIFLLSSFSSLLVIDSIFKLGCPHFNFFLTFDLSFFSDIAFW